MSSVIWQQLTEQTERSAERRRRVAEIRRESAHLVGRLHQVRTLSDFGCTGAATALVPATTAAPPGTRAHPSRAVPESAGVLDEVSRLLREVDARAWEHWDEDDTRLLLALQEAWQSATRKGYSLEMLQAILRQLRPQRHEAE